MSVYKQSMYKPYAQVSLYVYIVWSGPTAFHCLCTELLYIIQAYLPKVSLNKPIYPKYHWTSLFTQSITEQAYLPKVSLNKPIYPKH